MANYLISGVWMSPNGVITHYAIHELIGDDIHPAKKYSKVDAIELLETSGNSARTCMWSYKDAVWVGGEDVEVIDGSTEKYLRSDPDNTKTDNLAHLIDCAWMMG